MDSKKWNRFFWRSNKACIKLDNWKRVTSSRELRKISLRNWSFKVRCELSLKSWGRFVHDVSFLPTSHRCLKPQPNPRLTPKDFSFPANQEKNKIPIVRWFRRFRYKHKHICPSSTQALSSSACNIKLLLGNTGRRRSSSKGDKIEIHPIKKSNRFWVHV